MVGKWGGLRRSCAMIVSRFVVPYRGIVWPTLTVGSEVVIALNAIHSKRGMYCAKSGLIFICSDTCAALVFVPVLSLPVSVYVSCQTYLCYFAIPKHL